MKPTGLSWKYFLRLTLAPLAARLGRILGYSWEQMGVSRLGREVMIAQVARHRPVRVVKPALKPLNIDFLTMMGGNHRLCSTELVLGRALIARGHRVRYVLCDRQLPICEVKRVDEPDRWDQACAKCYAFGRRLLEQAGYEVLTVSELSDAQEDNGCWEYYVESAMLKHYRVGALPEGPEVSARRKLFLDAARVSARVGRALAKMQPDRVIMSHGIYCTWGPAREILNDAGVPLVTYGEGKKKDTIKFNWATSADWWDVAAEWDRVRELPLTAQQSRALDEYLASRREHSQDVRVYNFGREETAEATRRRLGLTPTKPTFSLFTNVLWDAASTQREIAFADPIEWALDTIRWFAEHPGKQLIVKIHPAEVVIGTSQPFAQLIGNAFPTLPSNVCVVPPEEEINSWSIIKVTDLGLVHTSTVGMELPLAGVPCAVVSKTHYRDKGFTFDVRSREEYFHLLESFRFDDVDPEVLKTRAKRYAHLLFERYQLPFPFLREVAPNDVRSLAQLDEVELIAHPSIELFLNAIENRGDFLTSTEYEQSSR